MASGKTEGVVLAEKLRLLKIEALEKGELTDISFLVGPEGEAELVHGFKSDLLVSSEYFRALFRSPFTGNPPIKMKHVRPHIFKLLLRHISTNTLENGLSIEDVVDLAHAADEYLLDELKSYYLDEIKKMANYKNVWIVLNRSRISQAKSLCDKILTSKTKECLKDESFLEASQESLVYLLKLNEMNIKSEDVLVNACLYLASQKTEGERVSMMKAALPHLRLLTLKLDNIPPGILEYLSDSEKAHLLTMGLAGSSGDKSERTFGNLCCIKQPRNFVKTVQYHYHDNYDYYDLGNMY